MTEEERQRRRELIREDSKRIAEADKKLRQDIAERFNKRRQFWEADTYNAAHRAATHAREIHPFLMEILRQINALQDQGRELSKRLADGKPAVSAAFLPTEIND